MPRRKTVRITNPSRVAETCIRFKFDPFEEMVKLCMFGSRLPDKIEPEWLAEMAAKYDIYEEDGVRKYRLKMMDRFDVMKECAQYVYPKLRSSETKEEKDFKLTVLIQSFDKQEPQRVEVLDVVPQITEGEPAA